MEAGQRRYRSRSCSEDDDPTMIKRCRFSTLLSTKNQEVLLYLPEELVIEIFEWLPVKSVLQLMCLAKNWSAIFKSPHFIENHHRKQGRMLLMRRCLPQPQYDYTSDDNDVLSFHDLQSPEVEIRPSQSITFLREQLGAAAAMPRASRPELMEMVRFVGSCNGIVCMRYGPHHILCNPALREFKVLQSHNSSTPWEYFESCVGHGFGVANGNDFKVVLMHRIDCMPSNINESFVVMVHLYTSRTKTWRRIDDAPVLPVNREDSIFLNGSCHWLGRTFANHHKTILSFGMESEGFKEMVLPDCLSRPDTADANLMVLNNGCLGLVQYQGQRAIEVWAMKEYGVKESWNKMFVLSPQRLGRSFTPRKNDILMAYEPVSELPLIEYFRQQDHKLLDEQIDCCQLTSVSLHTNQRKQIPVYGLKNTMSLVLYAESLVSLN